MSEDVPVAAPVPAPHADDASKPITKRFRRQFNAVRVSPDEARRQGRIAVVAWERLGGRDAVMAFLNGHDEELGGRPLDLAVASDDGLARVERALAERAAG